MLSVLAVLFTALYAIPAETFKQYPSAPDSSDATLFMQYSVAAYCPSTIRDETWSCGWRCNGATSGTVIVHSHTDFGTQAAGYVGYNIKQKRILVMFRGTSSIQSAIQDILLWKTEADNEMAFVSDKIPKDGILIL